MNREQALQKFWSSFDIPAYDESTVPDGATLPYITYNVGVNDFGYAVSLTASIWYKGYSWAAITEKLNDVEAAISRGGKIVTFDDGAFWIKKGSPFAQRIQDEDDTIRRIFMNVEIEYI